MALMTAKPGKFLCSVKTARTRKNKPGKELLTDWGNFLGRIVFSWYCLLHLILCQLAKSYLFARIYSLSTRNIIIRYRTFIACLNTLSIWPTSKKKKEIREKLCYSPWQQNKKKNNFYPSYHTRKSNPKSYYNLRPRFRSTPGSSQRKSATSQQIVEDYCYQRAQEENENQIPCEL